MQITIDWPSFSIGAGVAVLSILAFVGAIVIFALVMER